MRRRQRVIWWTGWLAVGILAHPGWADQSTPFIDSVNQEIKARSGEEKSVFTSIIPDEGSYTEHLRKKLDDEDAKVSREARVKEEVRDPRASFIEEIKLTDPKKFKPETVGGEEPSYTEQIKKTLEPERDDGAIEAVEKGHSELHAKKKGQITQSYGFRYALTPQRNFTGTADAVALPFNTIYGNHYAADLSFFYEYQFFHSELWGSLGLMGLVGFSYFHGQGQFAFPLENPAGGVFSLNSNTLFQFFLIPVTAAVTYRFNLPFLLRPYIAIGPTLNSYVEMRNDYLSGNKGHSQGIFFSAGVSLLMDWLSSSAAWELYTSQGVQHFYITLDYSQLSHLGGEISIKESGLSLGLTFEF